MKVMGIDPGLATMGWGVVETAPRLTLLDAGVVTTAPDMRFPERLHAIFLRTGELLARWEPEEIVFEELFFAKNITTAIAVSQARGSALCACCEFGKPLYEYTPMQIKQAVTGNGKAEKMQVQQMVRILLGLKEIIRPDDAADAVAAAVTHVNTGRMREQFRMR